MKPKYYKTISDEYVTLKKTPAVSGFRVQDLRVRVGLRFRGLRLGRALSHAAMQGVAGGAGGLELKIALLWVLLQGFNVSYHEETILP